MIRIRRNILLVLSLLTIPILIASCNKEKPAGEASARPILEETEEIKDRAVKSKSSDKITKTEDLPEEYLDHIPEKIIEQELSDVKTSYAGLDLLENEKEHLLNTFKGYMEVIQNFDYENIPSEGIQKVAKNPDDLLERLYVENMKLNIEEYSVDYVLKSEENAYQIDAIAKGQVESINDEKDTYYFVINTWITKEGENFLVDHFKLGPRYLIDEYYINQDEDSNYLEILPKDPEAKALENYNNDFN